MAEIEEAQLSIPLSTPSTQPLFKSDLNLPLGFEEATILRLLCILRIMWLLVYLMACLGRKEVATDAKRKQARMRKEFIFASSHRVMISCRVRVQVDDRLKWLGKGSS